MTLINSPNRRIYTHIQRADSNSLISWNSAQDQILVDIFNRAVLKGKPRLNDQSICPDKRRHGE